MLGDAGARQDAVRAQTTELGREVAELRDRAHEISPRSQYPANAAAELLGRTVPEAMSRAGEMLHQGRPAEAQRDQRYSADLAEHAARLADDLAAAIRADRPAEQRDATPSEIAAAQAAQRAAAARLASARNGTPAAVPAQSAAAAMRAAANGLRAASRPPRAGSTSRPPAGASNGPAPNEQPSNRIGEVAPDLDALKAAVRAKTGRAWGELPGRLRTEILQMSQGRYRDDYARLIELYFREIAADSTPRDGGGRP